MTDEITLHATDVVKLLIKANIQAHCKDGRDKTGVPVENSFEHNVLVHTDNPKIHKALEKALQSTKTDSQRYIVQDIGQSRLRIIREVW